MTILLGVGGGGDVAGLLGGYLAAAVGEDLLLAGVADHQPAGAPGPGLGEVQGQVETTGGGAHPGTAGHNQGPDVAAGGGHGPGRGQSLVAGRVDSPGQTYITSFDNLSTMT